MQREWSGDEFPTRNFQLQLTIEVLIASSSSKMSPTLLFKPVNWSYQNS